MDDILGVGDSLERMGEVEDWMRQLEATTGWQIVQRILEDEMSNCHKTLVISTESVAIYRAQGEIKMLQWMQGLPNQVRQLLIERRRAVEEKNGRAEPDLRGYPEL